MNKVFFGKMILIIKVEKGKSNLAAHNNSLLNQGRAVISDTNTLYKPNFLYRILPKSLCTQIKEHQSRETSAVFEHCRATAVATSTHTKFKLYLTKITPSRKPEQRKPSVNEDEGLDLSAMYYPLLGEHDNLFGR